jgi:hypothetical protein
MVVGSIPTGRTLNHIYIDDADLAGSPCSIDLVTKSSDGHTGVKKISV